MSEGMSTALISTERKSLRWSIVLSILMIIAGLLAIFVPQAGGIAATLVVGWLLIISGFFHLVYAWQTPSTRGLLWELLVGIVYLVIGGYLLWNPLAGLVSLTIALGIYLVIEGVLEFVLAIRLRPAPGSGWLFVHGIVSLVLAFLIWKTWPTSAAWVVGMLVGFGMLFSGLTRLMISLAARNALEQGLGLAQGSRA